MSATEYYSHTTYPATGAAGSSASLRSELELVEAGFGKLPDLSGNGSKIVAVNSGGTALESVSSLTVAQGGTGRATSTTAYALLAAGTTATGAHQTLAAGATTEILVGGGASALPVWMTANGTGAPVRTGSPTFTGVVGYAVGAVGAPSIYMTGYATTGWYNIGANNWGFAVSGAKVLDIASTGLGVTGEAKTTGNLGIGAAPGATTGRSLDIEGLTLTPFVVLRQTGTTANTTSYKQDNANSRVELSSDTFPIHLRIGGTSIATISSTGLAVTGTTSTTTGMAVGGATAGAGGIAFPATAVAVADANTLDDYEEGSWTPSQGSGLTLVGAFSSTGKYTKIGNVVTVTGTVSGATSVACASAALLTENLPFQASITGRGTGVAVKSGLDGACFFITGTNGISTFTAITACPTIFFSATYLV